MRHASLSVVLLFSMVGCCVAQSIVDPGAVTRILALEHAWNQAEQRKDAKAMDSILDDAIVLVDYDGALLTKSQFLARITAPSLHPEAEVTESMTAHVFTGFAVVTGVYMAKGVEKGKPYTRRGRFTDTWALKNGLWVCVVSQATPISR